MVQWLGLHAFTAEAQGSIDGCRTKIPQAMLHGKKKKKKKGKELGTEHPSSIRQQRVARRWAGGSQGYLSQKEKGREKTILRGDIEAQVAGERQPCRDPGSGP